MKHLRHLFLSLLAGVPALLFGAGPITVPPTNIQAHVAEKVAALPEGNSVRGENGLYTLAYAFTTERHDALFFELETPLPSASEVTMEVNGDGKGHVLFVVAHDQSGEKFYFPGPAITFSGWKRVAVKLGFPTINPGERYASIWGGDGNQRPDFPLRGLTIGLNDSPDTARESGEIQIRDIHVK